MFDEALGEADDRLGSLEALVDLVDVGEGFAVGVLDGVAASPEPIERFEDVATGEIGELGQDGVADGDVATSARGPETPASRSALHAFRVAS